MDCTLKGLTKIGQLIFLAVVVMESLYEDHSGNERKSLRRFDLASCVLTFNHPNSPVILF